MPPTCELCDRAATLYLLEQRGGPLTREHWLCRDDALTAYKLQPSRYALDDDFLLHPDEQAVPHKLAAVAIPIPDGECCVYLDRLEGIGTTMCVVGQAESRAIANAWVAPPHRRPLTHNTMASIIHGLGGALVEVVIDRFVDRVYCASLVINTQISTATQRIDSRPSDAISLALTCGCPIYVTRSVIRKQLETLVYEAGGTDGSG